MKTMFLILILVCMLESAAGETCIVKEPSTESAERYTERISILLERHKGAVDVDVRLPAIADGYSLHRAFLTELTSEGNETAVFVPIALSKLDGDSFGTSLTLPIDLFDKAVLIVSYGPCGTEHRVRLQPAKETN